MARLESADLVDDAVVMPPLELSEAGDDEGRVRYTVDICDV